MKKTKLLRHRIRLIRRNGKHAILTGGPKVTSEQVRAALSELP